MRLKLIIIIVLLVPGILTGCSAPAGSLASRVNEIVQPYRFSIAGWEARAIADELVHGRLRTVSHADIDTVNRYFSYTDRIKPLQLKQKQEPGNGAVLQAEIERLEAERRALRETVEHIFAGQIQYVLAEEGIHNPLSGYPIDFPRVNFRLEKPPNVLIISPRSKIAVTKAVTLQQELDIGYFNRIESQVDQLDVSSLVVQPSGFGATYPALVREDISLANTVQVACLEWAHQYLAFTPLGFRFVLDLLGIREDYDIYVMNETVAHLFGDEVSEMVIKKYYGQAGSSPGSGAMKVVTEEFSFEREMREIRRAVDGYLERGQVEEAERFMEEKRLHLISKGYYLRKLNQAYFAFSDSYPDQETLARHISPGYYASPVDAISGGAIQADLVKLRRDCSSLKDFIDKVSAMTGPEDLRRSLEPSLQTAR